MVEKLKDQNVSFTLVALSGIAHHDQDIGQQTVACLVGILPGTFVPAEATALLYSVWDVFAARGLAGDRLMIQVHEYEAVTYLNKLGTHYSFEETYQNGALIPGCSLGRQGDAVKYGSHSFVLNVHTAKGSNELLGVTCAHVANPRK